MTSFPHHVIPDTFSWILALAHDFIHLALASAAFIVVPSVLSLAQLYHDVRRLRSMENDMLTDWLFNHAFGLYTFSLLTGNAFSGVQICRSDMFGLSQFAVPLNHNQNIEFQSKKLGTWPILQSLFGIVIGMIDDCPYKIECARTRAAVLVFDPK